MAPVPLGPSLPDSLHGGRLGGAPPVAVEGHPLLATHRYLLTLPAGCAPWASDVEVTVLLRDGFDIGDDDLVYPDMAMVAIVHTPSPRGSRPDRGWPGLSSTALRRVPDGMPALVRVDGPPVRVQAEAGRDDAVRADGHRFLFQVDEDGWPVDGELADVVDEYLWGYGVVSFYGTTGDDGTVREVVAGLLDF